MSQHGQKTIAPRDRSFTHSLLALAIACMTHYAPGAAGADGEHPDFTGVYLPGGGRTVRTPNPLPYTPEALMKLEDYNAQFTDADDNPGRFCIPSGMPGAIWGPSFAIEIFHRPHDITMYFEAYSQYRKIYMEGFPRPEPILPTRMGYSVGHWEGDVLVVETTHLKGNTNMSRLPMSDSARIVERLRLEERDVNGVTNKYLVDDITLYDPRVYTEPVLITGATARLAPEAYVLEYSCSDLLWDAYLEERGLELPSFD